MNEPIEDWRRIAAILHDALPQIDQVLGQSNIAISTRKSRAFDIISETLLEVSDWEAFLLSPAHGRLHIIINDWYRGRYGDLIDSDHDDAFGTVILIHDTPFAMRVPKDFKIPGDEPNTIWISLPASVQKEENPLSWIDYQTVLASLSAEHRRDLGRHALDTANLIRSIGYDLRSLMHEPDQTTRDLAGAISSDLQASARHLCERSESGLRASCWDASQATEKALKLLIHRNHQKPPHTHDLEDLADRANHVGNLKISSTQLRAIPSKGAATSVRYGGPVSLQDAFAAYQAALPIIKEAMFEAKPVTKFNAREARLKIQRPPWLNFDTDAFLENIHNQAGSSEPDEAP